MALLLPYIYLYTIVLVLFLISMYCVKFIYNDSQNDNLIKILTIRKKERILDVYCFAILAVIVFLFIATRSESVGTDTTNYVAFFKDPAFFYNGEKTDILFELYGRILRGLIGSGKEGFIFISALLSFIGPIFLILKTSKQRTYSLLLFMIMGTSSIFFFLYLSMIRQCIAITYFLFAVYYLFQHRGSQNIKILSFIVLYTAAVLTHATALFALPFILWVYTCPIINKKVWIVTFFTTYILAALNISFVSTILDYAFSILETEHYSAYANVHFGMIRFKGWFNMDLLPYNVLAILLLYACSEKQIRNYIHQFALFSVALNNLFFDNLMWSRLIMYFSLFMIISIPNIISEKEKLVRYSALIFILVYYSYKTFSQLIYNASLFATGNIIVPYKSWLFNI